MTGAKLIDDFEKYLVIDVDGEGVTATVRRHGQSEFDILTINETPEAVKRSCVYCRKLLDTQRYQESIDWYRKFITEFGARYMVDDAQFEIANIYDQYLFDYPAALKEYRKLVTEYPNSCKVRQVSQRIEYLTAYADYDFNPLRIFEKAKSQTYQRDKKKAVAEIETIPAKYPGAKIEPQVLFWLGYTLAETIWRNRSPISGKLSRNTPSRRSPARPGWPSVMPITCIINIASRLMLIIPPLKNPAVFITSACLIRFEKVNGISSESILPTSFTVILLSFIPIDPVLETAVFNSQ